MIAGMKTNLEEELRKGPYQKSKTVHEITAIFISINKSEESLQVSSSDISRKERNFSFPEKSEDEN